MAPETQTTTGYGNPRRELLVPGVVSAAYLVGLAILLPHCWHQLNSDTISFVRVAQYWAGGDFAQAVNGVWPPLLSWLLVPFIWTGRDPLWGWYVVTGLSGLGFLWGTRFVVARFGLSAPARDLATATAALMALDYATQRINQDIVFAAILSVYLGLTLSAGLLHRREVALGAGLVAGIAFLAKAYAAPFVALHLVGVCVLSAVALERGLRFRGVARTLAWATLGAVVVAGPWVAALSWKYGHFTVSAAAGINRAICAPGNDLRFPFAGLHLPEGKALNYWEDPSTSGLPWTYWSPLDSPQAMAHQLRIIAMNLAWIRDSLATYTPVSFFPVAILAALMVALAAGPSRRVGFVHAWATLTIVIFIAGFAASYGLAKRYYWPLAPVFLALMFQWLDWLWSPRPGDLVGQPCRRRLAWTLAALCLVASCAPIGALRARYHEPRDSVFEKAAAEMARDGIAGPIATNNVFTGEYLSYYLNLKYAGMPASADPGAIVREMQALEVPTFIADTATDAPSSSFYQPVPDFSGCPEVSKAAEYRGRSGEKAGGFIVCRVAPLPVR